ncbi:MAG: DNA-processing protein DprA [Myxococcaceae bacterium]
MERGRLALLSLWVIPKLGPQSLEVLARAVPGFPAAMLDLKTVDWAHLIDLPPNIRSSLISVKRLAMLGERTLERARKANARIAFVDDPEYPDRLRSVSTAPPLLFYWGNVGAPRRRLAVVGCRQLDTDFGDWITALAAEVAAQGVGIVSGLAFGADSAAHKGALQVGGETFAFLGSALDQIDPGQRSLVGSFLEGQGVLFTELPPHIRANKITFPLRNRLIAGASDAVLVVRAKEKSGSLYTAEAAIRQGRPLFAVPGDVRAPEARGCNLLLRYGRAKACLDPSDVLEVLGVGETETEVARPQVDLKSLSANAVTAYEALAATRRSFEEVLADTALGSGALTSALCELELKGLVIQRPGKRYERV